MYYIAFLVALSGQSITTIQMPLHNVNDKDTCLIIAAKGSVELVKTSDHVEIVCMPVKK